MPAKVWKLDDPNAPTFPANYDVVKRATLQKTDIGTSAKVQSNKYFALDLHAAPNAWRVHTHYGRVDDLAANPNAGQKECRYFSSLSEAEREYARILKEKTGKSKGYQEVSLTSTKVGSSAARGQSSGHVDSATLARIGGTAKSATPKSKLSSGVRDLVTELYAEATDALTSTVQATITAKGVETPLGVLTLGQIEKGERLLKDVYEIVKAGITNRVELEKASSAFYTAVPHKMGRSRAAVMAAVIDDLAKVAERQETLQLMRDMLTVSGDAADTLLTDDVDQKYKALNCDITALRGADFDQVRSLVLESQVRKRITNVLGVWSLHRHGEGDAFEGHIGNVQALFHGSRARNWMGILSRGILLPKIVQTLGVSRTDQGWLGHGVYFGDNACTSHYYALPSRSGRRYLTVAQVALGKVAEFTKITYNLQGPPKGYDSCHGVRRASGVVSDFDDSERVVYRQTQQRLCYLVEIT